MTTNRFQPGDKVRVKRIALAPVDIRLDENVIYTVAHVDDFGRVSPQGDSRYFHPSHFELVMRAVADESYSLKDGEGDWWVYDAPSSLWLCWTHSGALPRGEFEAGIESIEDSFGGIDGTPTAPAETYCLKDKADGDWWHSADGENFRLRSWSDRGTRTRTLGHIIDLHGIDAEPTPTMKGMEPTYVEVDEVQNWPTDDGGEYETEMALAYEEPGNSTGPHLHFEAAPTAIQVGDRVKIIHTSATDASHGYVDEMRDVGDEFTVTDTGTNDHGPFVRGDDEYWWHPADLEKVNAGPAPLQPGDWVKVLARVEQVFDNGSVRALTFQSDGERNGPSVYAIASAITRTDEVPEWAKEEAPRCTSLRSRANGSLFQCDLDEHAPDTDHGNNNSGMSWTDAEEYGRVEVTER